jgi:hypothetical protein
MAHSRPHFVPRLLLSGNGSSYSTRILHLSSYSYVQKSIEIHDEEMHINDD